MTDDQNASGGLAQRGWRPSTSPARRMEQQAELGSAAIIDAYTPPGPIAAILAFLARPFVKIVLGLALFISAALVYDATINYGSWTMKAEKLKPTKHRGLAGPKGPQKMPD